MVLERVMRAPCLSSGVVRGQHGSRSSSGRVLPNILKARMWHSSTTVDVKLGNRAIPYTPVYEANISHMCQLSWQEITSPLVFPVWL